MQAYNITLTEDHRKVLVAACRVWRRSLQRHHTDVELDDIDTAIAQLEMLPSQPHLQTWVEEETE
jgi:hypothetical protein